MLEKMIPDAVQISGTDSYEKREEVLEGFASGTIRVLVTKPKIAGYGLNWQHCAHNTYFPSHSFEQWYQAIRRCHRFGQTRPVRVDVISSEGEAAVLKNFKSKAQAAEIMFNRLIKHMNNELEIQRNIDHKETERIPKWL